MQTRNINCHYSYFLIRKSSSLACANNTTLLIKTTATQYEDALSYHRVRGLYFQAVVFVATILYMENKTNVCLSSYRIMIDDGLLFFL